VCSDLVVRLVVTALAVIGFGLSVFGAFRLLAQSRNGVERMNADRVVRARLVAAQSAENIRNLNLVGEERERAISESATRWVEGHAAAGLEPYGFKAINEGREFLAERIIEELGKSTRFDVGLVLAGLIFGLASGVIDTWLN